jgi:hypothetical protein
VRGTDGLNTLSTHQGLGLGHSENLRPTSPQLMQALVLRRLLYSSSVSLPLALFQDSKDLSFSNATLRFLGSTFFPLDHSFDALPLGDHLDVLDHCLMSVFGDLGHYLVGGLG